MLTRFSKKMMLLMVVMVLLVSISYPCGPGLPNRILEEGDDYVLKSPEGYFYSEIQQISKTLASYFNQTNTEDKALLGYKAKEYLNTDVADINDLKNAFRSSKIDKLKIQATLAEYKKARQFLTNFKNAEYEWQLKKLFEGRLYDENQIIQPKFNPPQIPEGLPGEFEDYLRGAIFYHLEQFDKAKAVWEKLLNRPAEQRKYRSIWAAYMIGRILLDDKPLEAIQWFKRVRELANEGFVDSLGLAASSIGWEAQAELNQEKYSRSIELYMAQLAAGDRSSFMSLQVVCSRVLKTETEIQKTIAVNQLSRKVVTAYILSHGGPLHESPSPEITRKWLQAINGANINIIDEAGRFAWGAYSIGDTALASQWLSKASQNDIMAQWIAAKLLLQQDKIIDATKHLVRVARIISPTGEMNEYLKYNYRGRYDSDAPEIKTIRGELGTLYVSQRQYIEALDALMRGGYWEDAAYVAERILTIDELKTYIDKTWAQAGEEKSMQEMSLPQKLRYLLARRLTRLGRYANARSYYPTKWQNRLDAYVQAIENGNEQKFSKSNRAAALWKAAVIARYEGMELMGTELEPDWSVYEGSYSRNTILSTREDKLTDKITHSTSDELQRSKETIPPEKRFHYRYIAAEYAWQAAELMPDNSDQTARVLCIAGLWLNAMNDSQAADKFYKTLVKRCRKTSLGQKADEIHWFPYIKIDSTSLLKEVE
jgi:hypothetical protein